MASDLSTPAITTIQRVSVTQPMAAQGDWSALFEHIANEREKLKEKLLSQFGVLKSQLDNTDPHIIALADECKVLVAEIRSKDLMADILHYELAFVATIEPKMSELAKLRSSLDHLHELTDVRSTLEKMHSSKTDAETMLELEIIRLTMTNVSTTLSSIQKEWADFNSARTFAKIIAQSQLAEAHNFGDWRQQRQNMQRDIRLLKDQLDGKTALCNVLSKELDHMAMKEHLQHQRDYQKPLRPWKCEELQMHQKHQGDQEDQGAQEDRGESEDQGNSEDQEDSEEQEDSEDQEDYEDQEKQEHQDGQEGHEGQEDHEEQEEQAESEDREDSEVQERQEHQE